MVLFGAIAAAAQTPQLSLADLLIGLRSQKVSLPDRNRILTAAVRDRGITFAYTPEIAKELSATGASPELLKAIQEKSDATKAAKAEPEPDHTFYQRRAIESSVKGEYSLALADYNKALELRADDPTILIGRGRTHFNLKAYDLSVADFDRAIELNPKDSAAFFNRGTSFEQMGNVDKALADFKTAVSLDPENAAAAAAAKRIQDEIDKAEAQKAETARAEAAMKEAAEAAAKRREAEQQQSTPETSTKQSGPPEFINMGTLTTADATRMIMPVYSIIAKQAYIEGRVTVEVELDEKGMVVSAKAVSGHQMLRGPSEDAARKSRFRPAMFNGQPIKGRGLIVYNFSLGVNR